MLLVLPPVIEACPVVVVKETRPCLRNEVRVIQKGNGALEVVVNTCSLDAKGKCTYLDDRSVVNMVTIEKD